MVLGVRLNMFLSLGSELKADRKLHGLPFPVLGGEEGAERSFDRGSDPKCVTIGSENCTTVGFVERAWIIKSTLSRIMVLSNESDPESAFRELRCSKVLYFF